MKLFTKRKEDFVCENCGKKVSGNGYTNHCPNCLFSKHVDINPGDRACNCGGLMEPISILQKNSDFLIVHRCVKCGFERKNKVAEEDSRDELYRLMKKFALSNSRR
jgi:rubrerythrin